MGDFVVGGRVKGEPIVYGERSGMPDFEEGKKQRWVELHLRLRRNFRELWTNNDLQRRWTILGLRDTEHGEENVDCFRNVVQRFLLTVDDRGFKVDEDVRMLFDLVGFCRAFVIFSADYKRLWPRLLPFSLGRDVIEKLGSIDQNCGEISNVTREAYFRYALCLPSKMSWSESVNYMELICPEGAFSHDYSLEEAFFLIHISANDVRPWERSFWDKSKYLREQFLHIRCLFAGFVRILQEEERFPSDFSFTCDGMYDEASLVLDNATRFLLLYVKYIDSWPGFSEWAMTGPVYWLREPCRIRLF